MLLDRDVFAVYKVLPQATVATTNARLTHLDFEDKRDVYSLEMTYWKK